MGLSLINLTFLALEASALGLMAYWSNFRCRQGVPLFNTLVWG